MNQEPRIITPDQFTRRSFLQRGSAALGGAALVGALSPARFALGVSGGDELKLALVGCGGRGSGAANQALSTSNLGPVKLVAMADVHEDRMASSLANLQASTATVGCPEGAPVRRLRRLQAGDRAGRCRHPRHASRLPPDAVRGSRASQGKHVFMEKPVATDAAGVRRVLAAAAEAKKKNLKVGVGLQRHHQAGYLETIKRLHDGAIGDIVSMRAYWNGQRPWLKKRADLEKQPAAS